MPSTILGGDFTVHYASENNQKRIEWTGSSTGTRTLNELYSALQNLFDEPAQMDDLVPIKADTPDIYRLQNNWFMDDTSAEHLTGGSLFSADWKTTTPAEENVLTIGYAQTTEFNTADIGRTIRGATTGDTGTILDFNSGRALLWIRPDDPASGGDEFDNGTESYTIGSGANGDSVTLGLQDDGGSFTDVTSNLNTPATSAAVMPAVPVAGDAFYLGNPLKFTKLIADRVGGTQASADGATVFEYWDGSAWTALAGVSDATGGATTDGTAFGEGTLADGDAITFTVPSDWDTTTVNGSAQLYYIRVRVTTGYTTGAAFDQIYVSGVGAGAFASHTRHGAASVAGESAWVGISSIGTIAANSHVYIFAEDPDQAAGSYNEVKVVATKGTSDWWGDGQVNILLKVKEADSVFGQLPGSTPATAVATFLVRQYSKTASHFIGSALATAGGNTVVPFSSGDDLNNTTGYRNLVWQTGSSETLVDEELLYNVGTTSAGNFDAGVIYDDSATSYTDDTTDLNSSGAGDVPLFNDPSQINDAFYFGKDNRFTLLLADIGTAGTGGGVVAWEYWNGTAWTALTATDDSTSFTAGTGRFLVSWTLPSNWARTNVTNQPATAPTNLFYVRARVTTIYTIEPVLDQAWCGGEAQLKARVADTAIGTPAGATGNADYYLVGDPITDFSSADVVVAGTSRKTFDINGAPTNVGPAADSHAITFGTRTDDIGNGNGSRPYSIEIDPATLAILRLYERTRYVTRRGSTTALQGQDGEEYVGSELQVQYTVGSGTVVQGNRIVGGTSNAEAVVVANNQTDTFLILKEVRGTFQDGETLTEGANTVTIDSGGQRTITPISAAPFGTFAGGKFFGAPGVMLTRANLAATDKQAYQLVDDNGVTQIPPNALTITVDQLVSGDSVAVFRRTGSNINKTQFTLAAGNNRGGTTVQMNATISTDNPEDANSKLRIISSSGEEHRYRYDSYATDTFTLSPVSSVTDDGSGTNTTVVRATGSWVTDEVEVGDMVRHTASPFQYSRVTAVTALTLTVTDNGTSWAGLPVHVNTLVEDYGLDSAYVPLIERIADATSEANTLTDVQAQILIRAVVRNAGVILPFRQDTSIETTGNKTVSAIRNEDTIFT